MQPMLRIAAAAAATLLAAFFCGTLWRAGEQSASILLGCVGFGLLFTTLVRMQLEQSRRMLEEALRAVGGRIRVYTAVRLRRPDPGRGSVRVEYLVVGPGQRAWPLLTENISQWPTARRAQAVLGRRAAAAGVAAEAMRAALRAGALPPAVTLTPEAAVQPIVVPLRRRVAPERRGPAVIANMEELEDVLLDRQQLAPAPPAPATG